MTKWRPALLTDPQRLVAQIMRSRSAQDLANLTKFREFVAINGLADSSFDTQLSLIAAQMRSAHLAGTTIVSYLYSIMGQMSISGEVYRNAKRVINNFEHAFRHDEVRRAPELKSGEYGILLQNLRDPYIRVTVELMYVTAMRVADLADVAPWEVTIHEDSAASKGRISIQLCGGKNHRKFSERDVIHCNVSTYVIEYLRRVKASQAHRILSVTATEVGKAMSEVVNRHLTSYSLRNFKIYAIIESETDSQGRTDWNKVRMTTKHRGVSALKSAYQWRKG